MASSSSSHQEKQELNAFSGIEPPGKRRKVCESSRFFDVFINHRGPDVKHTLATELYNSLKQLGIGAFLDSQEKELGNLFPSTIETAIRSAKVHIAIFSKTYAESAWCLAELDLMLQSNAKIIPVFYEVKPSDLRHIENGAYADAFLKHKEKGRYLEKLDMWKEALRSLSYIAGEEFNSFSDWNCQKIVEVVQKEVQRKTSLRVAEYPVGLNKLVEDFERHFLDGLVEDIENKCELKGGEDKAKVVGIFGMGGVGKTTLVKELSNRKKLNYIKSSFLFDVREADVTSQLPHLQRQLLKDLFEKNLDLSFRSIEEGASYLKDHIERSPHLNFLIVVDDIDHVKQLDALLVMDIFKKSVNCLVIVTTRDVGVLITAGITDRYSLRGMDRNDGRELFCWHAFDQSCPSSGYEALVEKFLDMCGGLPLSFQVLGRHVRGRTEGYWRSELIKANKMLHRDVKKKLRISFESLDDEEKQVFIDIACFFGGERPDVAKRVLEGSGWNAHNAIATLKDKCLLEEVFSNGIYVLRMHDHLRDLGREMALEHSPPHRLWRPHDLKFLESMDFKTILTKTNIRCFHSVFDKSMGSRVKFFLGQPGTCFETSASLLWLECDFTPQPSIPSWIPLQNLQCLKIQSFSCRNQSSTIGKDLRRVLGSGDLIKLRELSIIQCYVLEDLPSLSCLEKIDIFYCEKLQNITLPTTLICLSVDICRTLQKFGGSGDLIKLTELDISDSPELEELPSLSRLSCVENIEIRSCEKLENITVPTTLISLSVGDCINLQRVVGSGDLIKLTELYIGDCHALEELPSLSRLSCMEKIEIRACEKLENIAVPTTLNSLSVCSCRGLQRVVVSGDLIKLTELVIEECPELEELPSLSRLSCMEKIEIYGCEKLVNIAGIQELHVSEFIILCWFSNAAIRNCIHQLKSVPSKGMVMMGRAVDGAESSLNEDLFSEADIGADALTEIVTQNSGNAERNADDIGCFVAVAVLEFDRYTDDEDIAALIDDPDSLNPGNVEVPEGGEWIITTVDWDEYKNRYPEDVLMRTSAMRKGYRVEVKKGEEWKSLQLLRTIVDRLHHL